MVNFKNNALLDYCIRMASPAVFKPGIDLYKQKTTRIFHSSDHEYIFEVRNKTKDHLVRILISQGGVIQSDCTCNFNKSGICKHQVAALIGLDKKLSPRKFKALTPKPHPQSTGYLNGDYLFETINPAGKNSKNDQLVLDILKQAHNERNVRDSRSFHGPYLGNTERFTLETKTLKLEQKRLYISGQGHHVLFRPMVSYHDEPELEVLKRGTPVTLNGTQITMKKRDTSCEEAFENLIRSLHPNFKKQFPYEFFSLPVELMIEDYWFLEAFERLKQADVEVYGLNELNNFRYNPHKASLSTRIKSGKDWFEVKVDIAFGDNTVSLSEVRKALINHEKYILLTDGTRGLIPSDWIKRFERFLRIGEIKNNLIRIPKSRFSVIDELFEEISDSKILAELAEKRHRLQTFETISDTLIPDSIEAELRPYQKAGYNWLNFLNHFGWGGILADDMGLGKTLQVITFLRQVTNESTPPSLVIVPTTLIFNWENELNKFCPSLKTLFYYGQQRNNTIGDFDDYQLIITTYGLIINDIDKLKAFRFHYVILDESQAIKNPTSKRYKAVRLLNAHNRLAMTGTPIENSTFDLFAQMSFVNPGLFGGMKHFRENYALPIDRDQDQNRAGELQRLIAPFLLRRSKEQVARELPPKTEDVIYCTMGAEQRAVYDAYRNEIRQQLLNLIDSEGIERSKVHILEGLTKLRQICDSPALLSDDASYGSESVKIDELLRHITEKTAHHKIVIFSQFVKMLKLLGRRLDQNSLVYEYLDGQTPGTQRKERVERFQSDSECRVFLISLKAGGTGINLTAADYVYLVDPWWNPAVESQAIDRCYRIGQDKTVFAYRMICTNSIEEKISEHQQKKRYIADSIITVDESFIKQLTRDDIFELFG